ncbi:hypothetical protein N9554_02405, partial [Candidatus Thioglobus sp.]|nr:hypothetical protein [Candidatus Thioglobus sp.]
NAKVKADQAAKEAEANAKAQTAIAAKEAEVIAKAQAVKDKTALILASTMKDKEIGHSNEELDSERTKKTNKEDRFLVLTHRRNLLSIMSSGLIGPKEVYGKYRDDILVKTKGLVPLFSRSISSQLIDLTTSNRDSNFPVILELDKDQLPDSFAYGVDSEGVLINNVNKKQPLVFRLSLDILSTNMIKEVHFVSEQNLTDFKARMFENVPIDAFSLSESPKIFESKSTFPIEFFDTITNPEFETSDEVQGSSPQSSEPIEIESVLVSPKLNNNLERFSRISDKVAASIALLSENMEKSSDLKLLHALLSFPYQGNNSRMREAYGTFAELISSLVSGNKKNKKLSGEYYLLSATLEELIHHNPSEGWIALDFLEKIELRFKASLKDGDDKLENYFEACKKIFNSTMEIPDGIFSDEKNIIQRAILLFLLRPDYEDLIGKENSQLNPGFFVKKIAILITGFRVGYERISTQFKGLHHQIFAPLRAYIINYGLGNSLDNFEKKPKAIVVWNPDERVYTFKYRLLKETIRGELSIKSYIHDVIQKMLDQDHIHEDFEILGGTLDYRFEYLESGSERKQPVNLDFDSVKDNLIISSPCFEITSPTHSKRITKVILQKIFSEDYDGKAYWVFEKKSITLKRVIHHDEIANIDIVDLINFIAKTADGIEEKLFKQDKVR